MQQLRETWVYLSAQPLLHLTLTLAAFQVGWFVYTRAGRFALLNPVLIAVALIVVYLVATGTDYGTYFQGAQFVHFLLGPATVALAIPIYRQFERVRRSWRAMLASLVAGSAAAAVSAIGIAWAMGAGAATIASLAPKSITTPVAMAVSEKIGGLTSLTSVFVIATGILGAMLGPPLLDAMGVRDPEARGVAIGTASHGIGAARAIEESEAAGAFAGLAMGLNALLTAILLPLIWVWLAR